MLPAVVGMQGEGTDHSLVQVSLVPPPLVTPLGLYWPTLRLIDTQYKTARSVNGQ